jgi:AcrR family transcriptional regulator
VELAPEDLARMTRMPPGRHHIPRDIVERHQRDRLNAAIVLLVNEKGYPDVSLTQIVKTAGIARSTFYEHFADKEELFLAVFDEVVEETMRAMIEAAEAQSGSWEEKTRSAFTVLLDRVAREPDPARFCLIESQSAGQVALERYEQAMRRFGALLRLGRRRIPRDGDPPEAMEEIIVGGVVWMIIKGLEEPGGDGAADAMLPGILEFVLTPYLGEPAAKLAAARPAA